MFDVIKEILISEKEVTKTNYKRLQEALVNVKNNLIDTDGGLYLTVNSLIEINSIITSVNNISLRKVNVEPYGFGKMCMDTQLVWDASWREIFQRPLRNISE